MNGIAYLAQVQLLPDWLQYGAFGLLAVVLWGIGRLLHTAGSWTGNNVVMPVKDAAVSYLRTQTEHTSKNTELLCSLDRGQREHTEALTNLSESVRNLYCAQHGETPNRRKERT